MTVFSVLSPLFFADTSFSKCLLYALKNSDAVGKLICVALFVFSVIVWVIMIDKCMDLRKKMSYNRKFLEMFRSKRDPLWIHENVFPNVCQLSNIYYSVCKRMESFDIQLVPGKPRRSLGNDELAIVEKTVTRVVEEEIANIQDGKMTVISTAVSACPYLGLFGTVWGITIAFTELAMKGKADIQTLAPGVSGALLTTVLALFVAIPSLIGYNIIKNDLNKIMISLDGFSEELSSRLKIEQIDTIVAAQNAQRRN